jgi:UDP-N-acetyl-D-glucosamine dehydrogenase
LNLKEKIETRKAKSAIIGMGYVGLPLAIEFAKAGLTVTGIDLNSGKIKKLNAGKSYIPDIPSEEIRTLVRQNKLKATTDFSVLAKMDIVNICVPTPLSKTKDPDVSYIMESARQIAKYLHKDQLIILESTTYPGTTDELLLPLFEETGLKTGKDFYLAFSPERIDPGNKKYTTKNIPKIVGGITSECTRMAVAFYQIALDKVIPVSSSQVAETVKLLENTFRSTNIGLVNELALMCDKLKIDVWEVIDAAATKPFGYMPFYPGPGLGGHCIPIDPFYLSWRAKSVGFEPRFIELAGQINAGMPEYVVTKIADALNAHKKPIKGSSVLVIGVAYKSNVDDIRESPALDILRLLQNKGAKISYSDPYIPSLKPERINLKSVSLTPACLEKVDCAVIVTAHEIFDYPQIVKHAPLIVDTRNALKGYKKSHIVRL